MQNEGGTLRCVLVEASPPALFLASQVVYLLPQGPLHGTVLTANAAISNPWKEQAPLTIAKLRYTDILLVF